MSKIRILSREVADIIAAGEVVENTASLVKELIENSLDANSTEIEITISNNARNIVLKDNGDGMDLEDLEMCICRHATSKIKDKEDLFNLNTYGFRGEALSSITAISKSTISSNGNRIYVEAGEIVGEEKIAFRQGTIVDIKDLFYNVPARQKFMRALSNEQNKIKDIVIKEALSNYNTSFKLYFDNSLKISTSGNGVENTILEIFNSSILKGMNKFKLGFLGDSSLQKSNRNYIFTYFNKRYARSTIVDKAIIDAYYTKLDKGRYPFVILFFDIDPSQIDVNVHPSKKLVKFVNEPLMYRYVRNTLEKYIYEIDRKISSNIISQEINIEKNSENNLLGTKKEIEQKDEIKSKKINVENRDIKISREELFKEIEEIKSSFNPIKYSENKTIDTSDSDYFAFNKFIGQIFRSFSIVECENKIEIYDNHIVQERILYEEIKDYYYSKQIISQMLLIPITITIDSISIDVAKEKNEFFKSFGFELEFNNKNIILRKVPSFNFRDSFENIVKDLIDLLKAEDDIKDIREEAIISMSCRKSIKAGDNISNEEMKTLINKLHKIKKYSCPHGRNIIVDIHKKTVESYFKR